MGLERVVEGVTAEPLDYPSMVSAITKGAEQRFYRLQSSIVLGTFTVGLEVIF